MKVLNLVVLLTITFLLVFESVLAVEIPNTVKHITAEEFQLENWQGKVVLMDFWASWCKPCEKSMPWLSHLQNTYGDDGLQIVAVNLDQDWQDALKMAYGLPSEVVLVHDPKGILADVRNLQGMPSAYLYDREGRLNAVHVGFTPSETADKEKEIEELLQSDGTEIDPDSIGTDTTGVQPWERDLLAAPGMEIDPDPVETALNEHVYFSKEATSGGIGSAGGGCGCN